MSKTTSEQGSGTRGRRRSRGSRSGLGIMTSSSESGGQMAALQGPVARVRATGGRRELLLLVLELGAHRCGQLVPRVDELLHPLDLEHAEDVVEIDAGVGDGLHGCGGLVVGLLDRRPGAA